MESFLPGLFLVFVLIYSVVIHELSHGLMARSMGDKTAEQMGRLTLNPIKHMDMFGSFILPVILMLTTGFIFGYAKPVPYNPNNLSDRRYGPAKVALAGPMSNIAMAVLFGLFLRFVPDIFSSSLLPVLIVQIVNINLLLAVFNLFPIPPLDGHWLLMTFLPQRMVGVRTFIYRYSLALLLVFMFFVFPVMYSNVIIPLSKLLTGI